MSDQKEFDSIGETGSGMASGFSGDFARNEVQLDLEKFLDLMKQNNTLEARVKELEAAVEANPWEKWKHLASAFDSWRVIPRALMVFYMWLLYSSVTWFQSLSDKIRLDQVGATDNEAMLISVVVGAGAAWFGAYVATGGKGKE